MQGIYWKYGFLHALLFKPCCMWSLSKFSSCWTNDRNIWAIGAAGAQLPYKQKVTGSNPVSPTMKLRTRLRLVFLFCLWWSGSIYSHEELNISQWISSFFRKLLVPWYKIELKFNLNKITSRYSWLCMLGLLWPRKRFEVPLYVVHL